MVLRRKDCNWGPTLTTKLSGTGIEAARRKFTPEFLNRLDKIVVFRALGNEEQAAVECRVRTARDAFIERLVHVDAPGEIKRAADPFRTDRLSRRACD